MRLPPELHIVHQPVRLQIVALLARHRDVGFADVRDVLGLTDGNLASHAHRLEEAGLLASRRALGRTGVVVRFRITAEGDARFQAYVEWLRGCLRDMDAPP